MLKCISFRKNQIQIAFCDWSCGQLSHWVRWSICHVSFVSFGLLGSEKRRKMGSWSRSIFYIYPKNFVNLFVLVFSFFFLLIIILFSKKKIILSTAQIFGAIMFVFTEVWDGQPHLHGGEGVLKSVVYYWFAFWVCNFIWIIFPSYVIYDVVRKNLKKKIN